ncbi:MAG: hypothetical protein SO361_05730 [Lachnospira sp.]|nr:hypothetical protein [Lachnospira sp.]
MFDTFGEFDSAEEINKAAANQRINGDMEAIREIAAENGLDPEDAEDFINGDIEELTTITLAAHGKLKLEKQDLELKGVLEDWCNIVMELCLTDKKVAIAVRRKDKSLKVFMSMVLSKAFECKQHVSDKIVDITKVNHNGKKEPMRKPLYLGIPCITDIKDMVREYYC